MSKGMNSILNNIGRYKRSVFDIDIWKKFTQFAFKFQFLKYLDIGTG